MILSQEEVFTNTITKPDEKIINNDLVSQSHVVPFTEFGVSPTAKYNQINESVVCTFLKLFI